MAMSEQEVFDKVRDVLVEALGVDEDEVTPEAKLFDDLGAESIDVLDIAFRLEKAFDIKIERGEMYPEDLMNNPEYVQDGKVTDKGMAELKQRVPFADLSEFEHSRSLEDFPNIFTTQSLVKFVQQKLDG